MALLLLHLLLFALVAAATWLTYAQRLQLRRADEWVAQPSIDYATLHAQWERERETRQWDALVAQVRRWDECAERRPCPVGAGAGHRERRGIALGRAAPAAPAPVCDARSTGVPLTLGDT